MTDINNMGPEFKVDFDENCASLQIPKAIYLRILNKAIALTDADIVSLEAALPAADYDAIQSTAHRLKGDYGNLRIGELSALAKKLNEEVVGARDKDKMAALISQFKLCFQRLKTLASSGQEPGHG